MDYNKFRESMELIADNFRFKMENKTLIKMIFKACDSFSDEDLQLAFRSLLQTSREDWNNLYPYGAAPPFADWIRFFEKGMRDRERASMAIANLEAVIQEKRRWVEKNANEVFPNDPEKAKDYVDRVMKKDESTSLLLKST